MLRQLLSVHLLLCLFSAAALATDLNPPLLKPGLPGKKRGEIIAPLLDEQIAAWCDFSKQIVITKTNTLCVYIGPTNAVVATTQKNASNPLLLAAKKKSSSAPQELTPTPYEMKEYGAEA